MSHLTESLLALQKTIQSNPIMSGVFSLWGLSVLTYLGRHVPNKTWGFIKRQCTTSLTFNSESMGYNLETFAGFMDWFEANALIQLSRTVQITPMWGSAGTVVGLGQGTHFFRYKGKLFWLLRYRMENASMTQVIHEVTVTTLGRNRKLILELVDQFLYKPDHSKVGIYTLDKEDGWRRVHDTGKRSLNTVVINQAVKVKILQDIDLFRVSRQWYEDRGFAYKLTFLLYGIHGTGKSSFVKALASHYGMNLCVLNITTLSDSSLMHAFHSTPVNSIILIEDFDSSTATKTRRPKKKDDATKTAPAALGLGDFNMLSLSGILNTLDGVISLDNRLVFMTTNVLDEIDEAVVRKGRVDYAYEFDKLQRAEISEYTEMMFPNYGQYVPQDVAPILGCDLRALYLEHRSDPTVFITQLPLLEQSIAA